MCIARALLACDTRGASVLCLEDIIGTTDELTENMILGKNIGGGQAVFLVCEDVRMCAGMDKAILGMNHVSVFITSAPVAYLWTGRCWASY